MLSYLGFCKTVMTVIALGRVVSGEQAIIDARVFVGYSGEMFGWIACDINPSRPACICPAIHLRGRTALRHGSCDRSLYPVPSLRMGRHK